MKHALKYYERNGLVCDMRSSRKTFFPVMLNGKKIADVETSKIPDCTNVAFNILNGLEEETYHDLFKIFSQISKNNSLEGIFFQASNRFPRYRRRLTEEGRLEFVNEKELVIDNDYLKCVNGHFMVISHNESDYIIDKTDYKGLVDNNIEIVEDEFSPFSRMLVGGEDISFVKYYPECFFLHDLKALESISFEYDERVHAAISLSFLLDNKIIEDKIVIPKIKITKNENTFVTIRFIDRDKKPIPIEKDMFDFRNVKEYDDVQIKETKRWNSLTFNVKKPELKRENEPSL